MSMQNKRIFLTWFQPSVPDYDPVYFLRCHSEGNDPSDEVTKVWRCAFEPSIEDPGKYLIFFKEDLMVLVIFRLYLYPLEEDLYVKM